ncbi:hypothetical protein CARUB_v10016738mg [Capsella rubella]|uniref:Agenet domain-containing protein n=1 Tax=Capsella rubella TaxID=81985 RepID=R0HET1_9BRAS|nr:DUF724 domain-containing protein 7 isoform X2 [Capsella rubella]EOA23545.1 hypothetical protein CARUB_v10016738mg [Capsella rubella]
MLLTTGRKEKLSISKGSEIEVSSCEYDYGTGTVWYRVILEENLAKSKRKKLSVRHLNPLLKEDYSPPLIQTTVHRLIRPVPPPDPFPEVDFEEGDVIDAAYRGGWWSGSVIKVLGNRRFLVYLRFKPDVIEIERKDLRPHWVWKDDEWFRCEKQQLIESDFSAGKSVEVRTAVDHLGDVWAPAIAIKENDDETLLVKLKALSDEEVDCANISIPYSKIRPLPPPCGLSDYKLMDNVDALISSGWCPGVVSKVLSGKSYAVALGSNKESKEFSLSHLRPSIQWKDGVWHREDKVSDSDESSHAVGQTAASTRIRVTVRPALREKTTLGTGKTMRVTRSSNGVMQNPLPASSNGGDVEKAGRVSVTVSGIPLSETVALTGELGSNMADVVMNENTPVTSQQETPATTEFHSSVVLGVAAATLTKPAVKTQGKTSPRKKLQAMKNQKGSTNDSVGEKAPEEMKNRESVNKRKRGQPRKFISTEPTQKTGVTGNGSKAATIELSDMTDEDRPLASWIHGGNSSSGQSISPTPDPGLNSVVETPPARESTMVLPFVKKSPIWEVLESMEVFKAVPQRPHFSPLLESEEEFREGDAIGTMVKFTALLEKVKNLQVDDPISSINRIDECFLMLEKHGFNVATPRFRISKLLSIKESQTSALDELKAVEEKITENDNKRRKCEEEIVELQRQEVLMKEAKVALDKEIALMQSHAAVLDQRVQKVDQEFQAIVAAPWK